ncbi:hypothetical protein Sango_2465900 [Sesamum angolense]|uniref:Uncharacterized protein n=1 Tax=Sesamum angolense TaxID=2727404 RepID=A0AAE2BKD0_9LAMI|nr:hypothetical protein Sango_2465900 [Sesamum angolense]
MRDFTVGSWWFNCYLVRSVTFEPYFSSLIVCICSISFVVTTNNNPFSALHLGAAAACGFWRVGRSVESSVEHILSLEGTRIQRELANIMLMKYHNDPWVMQRLSKHFYSEEVYDDSSIDRPKLRWRFRNFFGDPVTRSESTSYRDETDSQNNDIKKTTTEPKQVNVDTAWDIMENPFDLIFGQPGDVETVPHADTPSVSSVRQRRRERRARRRHRRHHQDESDV